MSEYYGGRPMFCQVSTSSIKVKLRHRQEGGEGFDCSAHLPRFVSADPTAANICSSEQIRASELVQLHENCKRIHLHICLKILDDT